MRGDEIISAAQIRAARGLLDWSQGDLAEASAVSRRTIAAIERGNHGAFETNLLALRESLEAAGILFHRDAGRIGVSLAQP